MNGAFMMQSLSIFCAHWIEYVYVAGLQALIVAIVIGAVIYLLRNRISSQLKYALLLVVLVKFAMPPFWINSGPVGLMAQPQVAQLASAEYVFQAVELTPMEQAVSPPILPTGSNAVKPDSKASGLVNQQKQAAPLIYDQRSSAEGASLLLPHSWKDWLAWIAIVYLIGVAWLLLRLAVCYSSAARRVASAKPVSSGPVFDRFRAISQQLKMGYRVPRLRVCEQSDSPFAIGVLRPTVVVPAEMVAADNETLDIVLAHELAHIKRYDLAVGWGETLLSIVWWFHPAMYWLTRQIRKSREDCCDDLLLATGLADADQYCQALIGAPVKSRQLVFEPVLAGFFGREHAVARRIRRLMSNSIFRSASLTNFARGVFLLACLTLLPGMQESKPQSAPVTKTKLNDAFGGWRNLPFKISEAEREAVEKCRKICRLANHTSNGVSKFAGPDVEKDLLAIIDEHPKLFLAYHLLGTWYQQAGDDELAKKHFDSAFAEAPVVLVQNYRYGNGEPAAGLEIKSIAIECKQVQSGSLSTFDLEYLFLKTDDKGNIRLPVYDTVYRFGGYSNPKGDFSVEKENMGCFESKAAEGIMPACLVWKTGSQPDDFSRTVADSANMSDAKGAQQNKLTVGGNVFEIGSVSRAQGDNSFTSEDGQGESLKVEPKTLPDSRNAAFVDHAIIDFSTPNSDQFAIRKLEVRDGKTNLPLRLFQNGTAYFQTGDQRISIVSLFEKLPSTINLVMDVESFGPNAYKLDLPAEINAEVENDQAYAAVVELAAGHHRQWTAADGFGGEHNPGVGKCEVVLEMTSFDQSRMWAWVVLKSGRRWKLDSFSLRENFRHFQLPVPITEIDHFEIRPETRPVKMYFEGIQLPDRVDNLAAVPPIESLVNRESGQFTSNLLSPLRVIGSIGPGDGPSRTSARGHGSYFSKFSERNLDSKFYVTWRIPALAKVNLKASYSDGMDEHKSRYSANTGSRGVCSEFRFDAHLQSAESVSLILSPKHLPATSRNGERSASPTTKSAVVELYQLPDGSMVDNAPRRVKVNDAEAVSQLSNHFKPGSGEEVAPGGWMSAIVIKLDDGSTARTLGTNYEFWWEGQRNRRVENPSLLRTVVKQILREDESRPLR